MSNIIGLSLCDLGGSLKKQINFWLAWFGLGPAQGGGCGPQRPGCPVLLIGVPPLTCVIDSGCPRKSGPEPPLYVLLKPQAPVPGCGRGHLALPWALLTTHKCRNRGGKGSACPPPPTFQGGRRKEVSAPPHTFGLTHISRSCQDPSSFAGTILQY